MSDKLEKLFGIPALITDEIHYTNEDLTAKQHLLRDIYIGYCKLIARFNKGLSFVVYHKGLLYTLHFDDDGRIISCDTADKNWNFEQFVDLYGDAYEFSHVMFEEIYHFIYVIPTNIRPWMKANIAALSTIYWCVHRHFIAVNGPLPPLFKYVAGKEGIVVRHYIRDESSIYSRVSYETLMAQSGRPPVFTTETPNFS